MNISVLVPYRPDHGHRDRAWAWIERRWRALLPDVEIVVHQAPAGATPAQFNHPWAINRAAERAAGDVFVVADADTAFDPDWVRAAAGLVADGDAPWVLPRYYDQLTEQSTTRLLQGDPAGPIGAYDVGWRGDSVSWSGLVVVPREGFEAVSGYDERWAFWGGDDVTFACSMNTLHGPVVRCDGAAMHCWHPRTHLDAQPGDQHDLMNDYLDASGNPEAMRALIAARPS